MPLTNIVGFFPSLKLNSMLSVFPSRFQITNLRNQVPVISKEFLLRRLKTIQTVQTTGSESEVTREHQPHQIKTNSTQSHGTDAPQPTLMAPGDGYGLRLLPHKPAGHPGAVNARQVMHQQHRAEAV